MKTGIIAILSLTFTSALAAYAGTPCNLNVQPPTVIAHQVKTESAIGDHWGPESGTAAALFEECRAWIRDDDNVKPEDKGSYTCQNYQYFSHFVDGIDFIIETDGHTAFDYATVDIVYQPKLSVTEMIKAKCERISACIGNAGTIEEAIELRKATEALGCQ